MADKEYVLDDGGIEREVISRKEAKEKGLKYYFTGQPCSKGHISIRVVSSFSCRACNVERARSLEKKMKDKKYREVNKEKIEESRREYYKSERARELRKERSKRCYDKNKHKWKDRQRKRDKERYWNNVEEEKARNAMWCKENRDKINQRSRMRRKSDPGLQAQERMRGILKHFLTQAEQKKDKSSCDTLGYSFKEFKEHIESRFLEGMSWDNSGEWHIDHLYPVSRFVKDGVCDAAKVNALENLAPMWAPDNLSKSDSTLEEFLERRPDLIPLYGHLL